MHFWIKISLLAGFTWGANEFARSDWLWNYYYEAFGTVEEQNAYIHDQVLRNLASEGVDPRYIESVRHIW